MRPNFHDKKQSIPILIEKGYIEKVRGKGTAPTIFSLTDLGLKKAKELLFILIFSEIENT